MWAIPAFFSVAAYKIFENLNPPANKRNKHNNRTIALSHILMQNMGAARPHNSAVQEQGASEQDITILDLPRAPNPPHVIIFARINSDTG